MVWKLADAKSRLSELMNCVLTEGPQVIRRRHDEFVVMEASEYRELTGSRPTLKSLLLHGPSLEGVDVSRDRSPMRDVDL